MNFSGISNQTTVGRLLRIPFQWIPGNVKLPILQGRLRGKKWIAGSSSHGCWLGSYEYEKRLLFEKIVAEGNCVFDIGANVGFYTLLASVIVGATGHVCAFEPVPSNLAYLKEHLLANDVSNVEVFDAAVSDHEGRESFQFGSDGCTGRLSSDGEFPVACVSLDAVSARGELRPPNLMKIDVEGAELAVLRGARQLLEISHPTILLATHGIEVHRLCCDFLQGLGYKLSAIEGGKVEETSELMARI